MSECKRWAMDAAVIFLVFYSSLWCVVTKCVADVTLNKGGVMAKNVIDDILAKHVTDYSISDVYVLAKNIIN